MRELVGCGNQACPGPEREPNFFNGQVEGQRGDLADPVFGRNLEDLSLCLDQVTDTPVTDLHAFRPASRP